MSALLVTPHPGSWIEDLARWERGIVHWITCTLHSEGLGRVLLAAQNKWVPVVLLVLLLAWLARRSRSLALRATFAAAAGWGAAMLVADVMWATIDRARPSEAYAEVLRTPTELEGCAARPEALALRSEGAGSRSFPSRHGLTVGVFVTALWLARRRAGLVAAAYGAVVCVGRVYAGKHWPSDVVVGVLLGGLLAWLAWRAWPPVARFLRLPADPTAGAAPAA